MKGKNFVVLAIERYMGDRTRRDPIGVQNGRYLPEDVFQVTLLDMGEEKKLKVLLDGMLNKLIQRNEIQAGNIIICNDFRICYNESNHVDPDLMIITGVTVIRRHAEDGLNSRYMDEPATTESAEPMPGPSTRQDTPPRVYNDAIPGPSNRSHTPSKEVYGQNVEDEISERSPNGHDTLPVEHDLSYQVPDEIEWSDAFRAEFPLEGPLMSSRGYFNNVWSSAEVCGDVWKLDQPVRERLGDLHGDIFALRELRRELVRNPLICVKVLLKFRIFLYPKQDRSNKWPMQAWILVGDSSGVCTIVLWNKMVADWYYSLSVGDVLLIRKFALKPAFKRVDQVKLQKAAGNARLMDFELSINHSNPSTELIKMKSASIPDDVGLPPILFKFRSRYEAGFLAEDSVIDVVGVVVHVGRYEREHMPKHSQDSAGFWIRQWVHLCDGSIKAPFCVQIYHASIGLNDVVLKPGKLLLCTNMRVIRYNNSHGSSRTRRFTYFTSTGETEVKVLEGESLQAYRTEAQIQNVDNWSKTDACRRVLVGASVGGHTQEMQMSPAYEDVFGLFKDIQPTPSASWLTEFSSLMYRETRQVNVMAFLAAVHYHPIKSRTQKSPTKSRLDFVVDDQPNDMTMPSIGSKCLDIQESFPMKYSAERWPDIQHHNNFPSTELQTLTDNIDEDPLEVRASPYFTFIWLGMNDPILLYTHLICPHKIIKKSCIKDILSGHFVFNDKGQEASLKDIPTILSSAGDLKGVKMHVILDFYQISTNSLEITVKRAFKSNRQPQSYGSQLQNHSTASQNHHQSTDKQLHPQPMDSQHPQQPTGSQHPNRQTSSHIQNQPTTGHHPQQKEPQQAHQINHTQSPKRSSKRPASPRTLPEPTKSPRTKSSQPSS